MEGWWSENYAKYSLQQLDTWEIYRKFRSLDQDFEREEEGKVLESFHRSVEAAAYHVERKGKKEALVHYPEAYTWMYECTEGEVTWSTWKNPYAEWGLIVWEEKGEKESWKVEEGVRIYEHVSTQDNTTLTHRSGLIQPSDQEPESWSEDFIESPIKTHLERKWKQHGSSGTEIRGNTGNRTYGDCSFRSGLLAERKQWSVENGKEQGSCTGFTGKKQFSHHWDYSEDYLWEERVQQEGAHVHGTRRKVMGEKWLKEEWQGLQPLDQTLLPLCSTLLDASESTLKSLTGHSVPPKLQHFLDSRQALSQSQTDSFLKSSLELALEYEHLKTDFASETGLKSLNFSLEELLSVQKDLLKQLLSSPISDSTITDSSQRVNSQIDSMRETQFSSLGKATELTRLIKDQTRLIQVLTRKLLNHETETRRVLREIQTHLEFAISNIVEEGSEMKDSQWMLEEVRGISRISDLLQVLPPLISSRRPSTPPSDPFLEELRGLMVNLESRATEIASILGVEPDPIPPLSPASSPYHDLYRRGNSVLQLLWKATSQAEIVQIAVTTSTEEVTTNMSVTVQKKEEKITELMGVVELRTRVISELNKELDALRNVHHQLQKTEESLAILTLEKAKEQRRADAAEQQLAALRRLQPVLSPDSSHS